MRCAGRALALVLCFTAGLATGTASVALHRWLPVGLLGPVATLATMWALRWWVPRGATALAAGWLTILVSAVLGRAEGDVLVSADGRGWLLVGVGALVLVAGIAWGSAPTVRSGSGSAGPST